MTGKPTPNRRQASYYHKRPLRDPDWLRHAACIGSDIEFLPNPADYDTAFAAKAVCHSCVVRVECLDNALKTQAPGIRGGHSETERRWMRKR